MSNVGGTTARKKRIKARMLSRQAGRCAYCRKQIGIKSATFDHIVPRCMGGGNTQDNLCLACRKCNGEKGCAPPHVFLMLRGIAA